MNNKTSVLMVKVNYLSPKFEFGEFSGTDKEIEACFEVFSVDGLLGSFDITVGWDEVGEMFLHDRVLCLGEVEFIDLCNETGHAIESVRGTILAAVKQAIANEAKPPAREAVSCDCWRWEHGMRIEETSLLTGGLVLYTGEASLTYLSDDGEECELDSWSIQFAFPELSHHGTIGLLTQRVGHLWEDPDAFLACVAGSWRLVLPSRPLQPPAFKWCATRGEALVDALKLAAKEDTET